RRFVFPKTEHMLQRYRVRDNAPSFKTNQFAAYAIVSRKHTKYIGGYRYLKTGEFRRSCPFSYSTTMLQAWSVEQYEKQAKVSRQIVSLQEDQPPEDFGECQQFSSGDRK